MEKFKQKANDIVNSLNDQEEVNFIITFNKTLNRNEVAKYLANVKNPLLAGRGISNNNERITTFQADFNEDTFNIVQNSEQYKFKGYIQLSGKASGQTIKNLLNNKQNQIFCIEVEKNNNIPLGLFWKVEDQIK